MILCDREFELARKMGHVLVDPPPPQTNIDSTTVDLRLDVTLDRWEFPEPKPELGQGPHRFCPGSPGFQFSTIEKEYTRQIDISTTPYVLPPSYLSTKETGPLHFILGWTYEKIYFPHTSRLCARVEGKSSLGRMGLGVHVTAPTIHAGFGFNKRNEKDHGAKLRLEIWNVGPLPIELIGMMRICQVIIEEVREVPNAGYGGEFNFQGPPPRQGES